MTANVRAFLIPFLFMLAGALALVGGVVIGDYATHGGHVRVVVTSLSSASMDAQGYADQSFLDTWNADTHYPVTTAYERAYTLNAGHSVCGYLDMGYAPSIVEQWERDLHTTLSRAQAHTLVSDAMLTLCPVSGARV